MAADKTVEVAREESINSGLAFFLTAQQKL